MVSTLGKSGDVLSREERAKILSNAEYAKQKLYEAVSKAEGCSTTQISRALGIAPAYGRALARNDTRLRYEKGQGRDYILFLR